ncbi:hypothetical protein P5673_030678 [Acropora cervicornis]|uniref:Uncharacterized protein n=1 Tax=Acropora cervicornis TaxID=6130 RepID=A0AAD9UT50_ACRCE|nr:hypothetical protein P5673_030678 [Acropora cervicornis]
MRVPKPCWQVKFCSAGSFRRENIPTRVNKQLRADLSWWANFLSVFNGNTFFVGSEPVSSDEFSANACPVGGGVFFGGVTGSTLTGNYQDLFSQPVFSSLPSQVQSMLKNSYFRKN